jgi:hypothetical protein
MGPLLRPEENMLLNTEKKLLKQLNYEIDRNEIESTISPVKKEKLDHNLVITE